jgi:hypothetical protein
MEKNLLGISPIKREGQAISSHCFEACQGIAMRDEIERLRGALREIASIDYRGPMPDGVQIARKALKEKE